MDEFEGLVVFHIGGGDDEIGPTRALLELSKVPVRLYIFEIIEDAGYTTVKQAPEFDRAFATIIPMGIGDVDGARVDFRVNKHSLSSSVLAGSWKVWHNNPRYAGIRDWKENTELDYTFQATLRTIDSLVEEGTVPKPDFLSMDIQGLELAALKGASRVLDETVLGVICESELTEIYENQGLFHHQVAFLEKKAMRFVDFLTRQDWFVGSPVGQGFFTVAESLFLKHVHQEIPPQEDQEGEEATIVGLESLGPVKVMKLALISFAFSRYGYFLMLLSLLNLNFPDDFKSLRESSLRPYFVLWERLGQPEDSLEKKRRTTSGFSRTLTEQFPHLTVKKPSLLRLLARALREWFRNR